MMPASREAIESIDPEKSTATPRMVNRTIWIRLRHSVSKRMETASAVPTRSPVIPEMYWGANASAHWRSTREMTWAPPRASAVPAQADPSPTSAYH